jgi:hypothetical protein
MIPFFTGEVDASKADILPSSSHFLSLFLETKPLPKSAKMTLYSSQPPEVKQ